MTNPIDTMALLAQRATIVQQIANGGASKRTLTLTLPLSRSTITRAIQDLTTANLLQKTGDNYELTLHGQIAYREFSHVVDRYDGLTAASPLLDHLPKTTMLPGVVFEDVTILRPSPPTPDAPRTRFADRVRQSEVVVGTAKILTHRMLEMFHEQLSMRDLQLSLLLDEQVAEHLLHAHYDIFCKAIQSDHFSLQLIHQMPPFSLTIIDWTDLWLSVYNERGQLQGILQTESTAAVEWGEQRLQQLLKEATVLRDQAMITRKMEKEKSS